MRRLVVWGVLVSPAQANEGQIRSACDFRIAHQPNSNPMRDKVLNSFKRSHVSKGSGGYPTCDAVPPCGVCDKELEYASENYPAQSNDKIAIPRSSQQRLDQQQEDAKDQHRYPGREDRVNRGHSRPADKWNAEKASRASHKQSSQKHHWAMNLRSASVFQTDCSQDPEPQDIGQHEA